MSGWDAVVVGGGTSGLIAAATLAKARKRTLLLEARHVFGGTQETPSSGDAVSLAGFDPVLGLDKDVIDELKFGLTFAVRDLPLVALRADGHHLVIERDVHRTARSLARVSARDAVVWPRFRREALALARSMRRLWWPPGTADADLADRETVEAMKFSGAAAWLARWFESESLRAALAFDATEDGAAVNAPPSALILVWRLAQEMSGLQGAEAILDAGRGGLAGATLRAALAFGAELRNGARVTKILVDRARACGVRLTSGETIDAPLILSSLSRSVTEGLLPTGAFGLADANNPGRLLPVGTARILISFDREPNFGDGLPPVARYVVAERIDSFVNARDMALAGQVPDELVFDAVTATPGTAVAKHALLLRVRPVPLSPLGGWDAARAVLAARAVSALGTYDRALKSAVVALRMATPEDMAQEYGEGSSVASVARLLQPAGARIVTPVENLLLCGPDAEPVSEVSGRAARLAARHALARTARSVTR